MSLTSRTTFALLPCLAASLATLSAQAPSAWQWRQVPLPPNLADLPMSHMAAGNFTGHTYPDVAFLAGPEVGLITAPGVHNAIHRIVSGLTATGLGTLRGAGLNGNDALLIATPTGVHQWHLGATIPLPVIATGEWHSLAVGSLGGSSELSLVGIGTGSNQVRVHRISTPPVTTTIAFPGETIAAVQLAQWDGVGGLEICVATNQRVWVGTEASTTLFAAPFPNTGNSHLVRVEMPTCDSLAWLVTDPAGVQKLMTLSSVGQSCDPTIQLGNVRELSSGRADSDLRGDLLVAVEGSNTLQLLTNVEGSTSGPAGVAQFVNMPESINPWGAQLVDATLSCAMLVELNADRHTDLVTLQASSNVAWIRRWLPPTTFATTRPLLGGELAWQQVGTLTMEYEIPINSANRPPGATHLDVLLFGAAAGTTPPLILQPAGLQHLRLAGNPIASFTVTQDVAQLNTQALVGIARWIRIDAGVMVNVWTPTRFAIAQQGMSPALLNWFTEGSQDNQLATYLWTTGFSGNNYVWRGLSFVPAPEPNTQYSTRGYEEPPDLPPPPVEPPTPPSPPPPDNGNGG